MSAIKKALLRFRLPFVVLCLFLALWELVIRVSGFPTYLLPGPWDVLSTIPGRLMAWLPVGCRTSGEQSMKESQARWNSAYSPFVLALAAACQLQRRPSIGEEHVFANAEPTGIPTLVIPSYGQVEAAAFREVSKSKPPAIPVLVRDKAKRHVLSKTNGASHPTRVVSQWDRTTSCPVI